MSNRIDHAAWEANGTALFGADMEAWVFRCFSCGQDMSMARARVEYPELKGCGWSPGQECLGRYTSKVRRPDGSRCDWAAYGLFRGPVIVVMPNGKEIPAFEFAPVQPAAQRPPSPPDSPEGLGRSEEQGAVPVVTSNPEER